MNSPGKYSETFTRHLVARIPALQPLLAEHELDNRGELLPHVFFGDVSRWAAEEAQRAGADDQLARFIDIVTWGFDEGPCDVQNLIVVSFIENVDDDSALYRRLPPKLQELIARPFH